MVQKDYMPSTDKGKAAWLKNFAEKLPTYATALKISESELTSVTNDYKAFVYYLDFVEMVKTYAQQITNYKDLLRDGSPNGDDAKPPLPLTVPPAPVATSTGILVRIRRLVQNIKTQKGYSRDIGKTLAIISEKTVIDYNTMKPEIIPDVTGGRVVVKWKKGAADSINIYVRRGTGDFIKEGNDAKPPYDDPTPLPAEPTIWTYKAMYVVNDKEIGKPSDEASVLVQKVV